MSTASGYRVWLLHLIMPGRWGRWITGWLLFATLVGFFWLSGLFGDPRIDLAAKSAALFFSVMIAYITPIYHYVTERTQIAFDRLQPLLKQVENDLPDTLPRLRASIECRPASWQALVAGAAMIIWLIQSSFLSGGFSNIWQSLSSSVLQFSLVFIPLLVWLCTSTVMASLVRNARLFSTLAELVPIDLLNTDPLMAFGRMAVSATLVMIGSLAALSLLWLGDPSALSAWLPGVVLTVCAMLYLLLVPILPLRSRINESKSRALQDVQKEIDLHVPSNLCEAATPDLARLSSLLTVRSELRQISEWPLDLHVLARFGVYLVFVPLTWVGAALIENLVNFLIE